jgi:lipoprotein-anchoring transpeptidase ErfK/SrfK
VVTTPTTVAGATSAAVSRPVGPATGWIATLRSAMPYTSSPAGPVIGTLPAADPFGAANVVAVIGRPGADGWSRVELPIRPDGSIAWMQTADTTLTWTPYRVAVSVAARTLTVTDGPTTVLTTSVAVGAPNTPTPAGSTYLWELIRPDDPQGAYGPYIFGLAMFSDAISVFNGGDAQIGIHGQDEPWSIGENVSHGCVRLENPVIAQLAGTLPLGTPVTIS